MSAKTKKQRIDIIPLPDESIKSWVHRYKALFGKNPDSAYMRRSSWPSISLVTGAQVNFSKQLQSALTTLKEIDPTGEKHYWSGCAQIWFTCDADAVVLKLMMHP